VLDYPHAPWWNPAQEFAPINPVGFVAGVLTNANVENEWLDRATAFCWDWITRAESFDQYALHNVQRFLAAHRHTKRGTELEAKARRALASGDVIPLDPAEKRGGDTHTPLHFVPSPSHAWRDVFEDHVVERFVDALENAQQPDGGWPIDWEAPGPAAFSEWRGRVTLEAMLVLRNYGRI
jgi:hypothetical protein